MYNKEYGIYEAGLDIDYFITSILRENLSGFSFSGNKLEFYMGVGYSIDKAKRIIEYFGSDYEENGNELIIKNIDEFKANVMKFIEDRIKQGKEYWVVKLLEFDEYSEGEWASGLGTYYFKTEVEARVFAFNNRDIVVFIGKEKVFNLKIDINNKRD